MIETGIKTLKINAIKINKTLAEGNKSMKKLRAEEQRLFRVQQNKMKLKQREDLIEGNKKQSFGSGIAKKVIQPVKSFIDKLKDFFILLGAGILVNSLPAIIATIDKFIKDNKGLIDNIKFIIGETGKLSMMFIELIQKLTPGKEEQIKKDLDKLNKFLDKTDGSEVDKSLKELKDIEKGLGTPTEAPGSLPINPNPIPLDQRLDAPINSESNKPVQVAEFNNAAKQVNEIVNNNNSPTNTKVFLPGVGYAHRSPTAFGSSSLKFEGPAGTPITKDEFFIQSRNVEKNIKGYSKGGTVKGSPYDSSKLTLDSKPLRTGSGIESFSVFKKTTIAQANNLGEKTKSNNFLEDLVDNVKKLFEFETKDDKDDKEDKEGNGGGNGGGGGDLTSVGGSGTGEQNLAAFLSTMEASGNQNQADAFQVMLNRTADAKAGGSMKAYGTTLGDQIMGREQFSPLSAAIYGASADSAAAAKYGPITKALGSNPAERKKKLLEVASQPDGLNALQKLFGGGSASDALKVLQDFKSGGSLSQTSASDIGSMVSFRGYRSGSGDFNRGKGGNFFFGSGSKGKVGSLTDVSPELSGNLDDIPYTQEETNALLAAGTPEKYAEVMSKIKKRQAAALKAKPDVTAPLPGLSGLKVNNPNIDRSSILSNDVSASTKTLIVFAKQDTIFMEEG